MVRCSAELQELHTSTWILLLHSNCYQGNQPAASRRLSIRTFRTGGKDDRAYTHTHTHFIHVYLHWYERRHGATFRLQKHSSKRFSIKENFSLKINSCGERLKHHTQKYRNKSLAHYENLFVDGFEDFSFTTTQTCFYQQSDKTNTSAPSVQTSC